MDLTKGKKFDRVAMTWVPEKEFDARKAELEERAFQRMPSQGELACPMIISDCQKDLMSMTNGKYYDSKSEMRKEYKRAGVIEVGDEAPTKRREKTYMEKDAEKKKRHASIGKALSQAGFGAP